MDFCYSEMAEARAACCKSFGSIFDLPLLDDIYDPLRKLGPLTGAMLDFGAGAQSLKPVITSMFPGLVYHSLDTDPRYACDYRNLEELQDQSFRLIIANQVLEHLPVEGCLAVMEKLSSTLQSGGVFFATVPNIAHPTRFMTNIDHKTFLSYTDLYYLALHVKFNVIGLYRYGKIKTTNFIDKFIVKHISAIYKMDFADSIAILAVKKDF